MMTFTISLRLITVFLLLSNGSLGDDIFVAPGKSYCTYGPDYNCYKAGWPSCCSDKSVKCPEQRPLCEDGNMMIGWSKSSMTEHEMVEKWDAALAEESNRGLVSSEKLKQLGEPVSVETQLVAGTNYRFKFADGTFVIVWETLRNKLKIWDIKRANGRTTPGGWSSTMSEREMNEKWDAVLAQHFDFWIGDLKQLGEPVSVETQVVAGTNYRFTFADGTIVPVFESLTHVFKIGDIKRATVKILGGNYCDAGPDYDCYPSGGYPACCQHDWDSCPKKQPECEGKMGRWEKNTMSKREMVKKWHAVLAEESKDLASLENLKQFGEPVSVETQVVAGTNYRFTFADGTTVTVWETLHDMFKIEDVNRATQKGCPNMECGCEPPSRQHDVIDEKTGCKICQCVGTPVHSECPKTLCGCPPPLWSIEVIDKKSGCKKCQCVGGNDMIPVKEDCHRMVCGCPPPLWSIDVIDTKTGCQKCQCVGGAELIPVEEDCPTGILKPMCGCKPPLWSIDVIDTNTGCQRCQCVGGTGLIPVKEECTKALCGCAPPTWQIDVIDTKTGCPKCQCVGGYRWKPVQFGWKPKKDCPTQKPMCGCEPPFWQIDVIDGKNGCEACQCVGGAEMIPVKEECTKALCGCKPPFWQIDVIDKKSGCKKCQCVGGAEMIPVKEDCQKMVCGCPPPFWSIDIIDTKTGCEICQCVGGAKFLPVKEVGTTYCSWSPDYSCFKDGHPSCCNDKSVKCPEQRPLCDRDHGKHDALLNLDLSSSQETPEPQVPKTPKEADATLLKAALQKEFTGIFYSGGGYISHAEGLVLTWGWHAMLKAFSPTPINSLGDMFSNKIVSTNSGGGWFFNELLYSEQWYDIASTIDSKQLFDKAITFYTDLIAKVYSAEWKSPPNILTPSEVTKNTEDKTWDAFSVADYFRIYNTMPDNDRTWEYLVKKMHYTYSNKLVMPVHNLKWRSQFAILTTYGTKNTYYMTTDRKMFQESRRSTWKGYEDYPVIPAGFLFEDLGNNPTISVDIPSLDDWWTSMCSIRKTQQSCSKSEPNCMKDAFCDIESGYCFCEAGFSALFQGEYNGKCTDCKTYDQDQIGEKQSQSHFKETKIHITWEGVSSNSEEDVSVGYLKEVITDSINKNTKLYSGPSSAAGAVATGSASWAQYLSKLGNVEAAWMTPPLESAFKNKDAPGIALADGGAVDNCGLISLARHYQSLLDLGSDMDPWTVASQVDETLIGMCTFSDISLIVNNMNKDGTMGYEERDSVYYPVFHLLDDPILQFYGEVMEVWSLQVETLYEPVNGILPGSKFTIFAFFYPKDPLREVKGECRNAGKCHFNLDQKDKAKYEPLFSQLLGTGEPFELKISLTAAINDMIDLNSALGSQFHSMGSKLEPVEPLTMNMLLLNGGKYLLAVVGVCSLIYFVAKQFATKNDYSSIV